jgi:hypothetical protein
VAVKLSRLSTKVTVVGGLSAGKGVAMDGAPIVPLLVLEMISGNGAALPVCKGTEVQPATSPRATTVSVSKLFMSVSFMHLNMNRQQEPKLENCVCPIKVYSGQHSDLSSSRLSQVCRDAGRA